MSRAQKLLKKLYEMGRPRRDALKKLSALEPEIGEHLFWVSSFPKHPSKKHWIKELDGWRQDLSKFNQPKKGKKKPNYTEKILWSSIYVYNLETEKDIATLSNHAVQKGIVKSLGDVDYNEEKIKALTTKFIDAVLKDEVFYE